jgi:hypothetical protein
VSIWSQGARVDLPKPEGVTDAYIFFNDTNLTGKIPGGDIWGISFSSPHLSYWIDMESGPTTIKSVLQYEYPKLIKKCFYKRPVAKNKGVYCVDLWLPSRGIENCWHTNPLNPHMMWFGTTIGVLANLVVFMGYRNIHFVNCDCVGYERYALRLFLFEFNELCKQHGVTCISHDAMSPLNGVMEYVP